MSVSLASRNESQELCIDFLQRRQYRSARYYLMCEFVQDAKTARKMSVRCHCICTADCFNEPAKFSTQESHEAIRSDHRRHAVRGGKFRRPAGAVSIWSGVRAPASR